VTANTFIFVDRMSDKYKISGGDELYFVTFTIVEWIKILADDAFKMIIIEAIRYYQNNKGLNVYAYCIMPNHIHMIIQAPGNFTVSAFLRDLKKYTSRAIVHKLESEKPEGYLEILDKFRKAGEPLKRIKQYKVWQDGNQAKVLYSNTFTLQKLTYIHNNPVKYGLCDEPWKYAFSSAANYAGRESVLEVKLIC
jgi:putative transposase